MRSSVGAAAFLLLVAPLAPARAQFPKIPGLPRIPIRVPVSLPSLDSLFRKDSEPITTGLGDVQAEVPFLDDYVPERTLPLESLARGPHGGFLLCSGFYEMASQSYCLHAGTYGPGKGDGYVYAPLKGARAGLIRGILQRSVAHPEISQENIQVLIWAIEARARIADMGADQQAVARALLSRGDIDSLNGGALGLIPDDVRERLFSALPPAARQVYEAEATLRGMLAQAVAPEYSKLEQVAVLTGSIGGEALPLGKGSRADVPATRWSYHPDGYFVRYQPNGYPTTTVQVSVPPPVTVKRDTLGRVTRLQDTDGSIIGVDYDDVIAPVTIADDPGVRAYAFRIVRFAHYEIVPPRGHILDASANVDRTGWTLVGAPSGKGRAPSDAARFTGLSARYAWAVRHRREVESLGDRAGSGADDIADIVTLGSLSRALTADPPLGTPEQTRVVTEAWQDAVCRRMRSPAAAAPHRRRAVIISAVPTIQLAAYTTTREQVPVPAPADGSMPSAVVEFDPSGSVATPANTVQQRLGQSGRPWYADYPHPREQHYAPPGPHERPTPTSDSDCDKVRRAIKGAKRIQAGYKPGPLLNRAINEGWSGGRYEKAVSDTMNQAQKAAGKALDFTAAETDFNDPNCVINIPADWQRDDYPSHGWPKIVFDAAMIHEQVHQMHCQSQPQDIHGDRPDTPQDRSSDETNAYQAEIDFLENWLSNHCQ